MFRTIRQDLRGFCIRAEGMVSPGHTCSAEVCNSMNLNCPADLADWGRGGKGGKGGKGKRGRVSRQAMFLKTDSAAGSGRRARSDGQEPRRRRGEREQYGQVQ